MSDNEFDHIFSENLKNARSVINPEENDWHNLVSKLDHFQSKRRNWRKVLPWILLPFLTGFSIWSSMALHHLKKEKSIAGINQYNQSFIRDTIIVEKEKYIRDTIYNVVYVNRVFNERAVSPVMNKRIMVAPSKDVIQQEQVITEVIKIDENHESISQIVDTLSAIMVEKKKK